MMKIKIKIQRYRNKGQSANSASIAPNSKHITNKWLRRRRKKYVTSLRKISNSGRKRKIDASERLRGFSKEVIIVSPQPGNRVPVSMAEVARAVHNHHHSSKETKQEPIIILIMMQEEEGNRKEESQSKYLLKSHQDKVDRLAIQIKLTINRRRLRQQSHHRIHRHNHP